MGSGVGVGVLALAAVAAALAAFSGVAWLRHVTVRRGVLDIPNERSLHAQATPRGGGLAIVMVTALGLPVLLVAAGLSSALVWQVLAAATAVAVTGGIDDIRALPARLRFLVHAVAAGWVIAAMGLWPGQAAAGGAFLLGGFGALLALTWVVGLTNAYNFMDGIDGLAAGQAVVAGGGWLVLGLMSEQGEAAGFGLLLAAASTGFAVHNWPPARIFMGDVGSTYIGFMLGAVTLLASRAEPLLAMCGALLVWPFVFDASFTFLRRLTGGEMVFRAHRSHLYQRLVAAGWSHLRVSICYILLALLGDALAIYLLRRGQPRVPHVVIAIGLACFALWRLVVWSEGRARTTLQTS